MSFCIFWFFLLGLQKLVGFFWKRGFLDMDLRWRPLKEVPPHIHSSFSRLFRFGFRSKINFIGQIWNYAENNEISFVRWGVTLTMVRGGITVKMKRSNSLIRNYLKNGKISLVWRGTTPKWSDLNSQMLNYVQKGGISSVRCGTT